MTHVELGFDKLRSPCRIGEVISQVVQSVTSTADVIVVGAGPSGCAAAIVAARRGLDVLLIDKSPEFPRVKVCGDALTPRAVAALSTLGIEPDPSWHKATGMAIYGIRAEPYLFPWPAASGWPDTAYTVPRADFDAKLLDAARDAGARVLLGTPVKGLAMDGHRAAGVVTPAGQLRARVVVDAAGASSRLAITAGMPRLPGRPMGVAARGYMRGAMGRAAEEQWLHSWLALPGPDGARLAGYGWVFPLGGGLYNVGVGQLSSSPSFKRTDYKAALRAFGDGLPSGWNMTWTDDPILSAALPMGLDRRVVYRNGVLVTGDAAGLVNPFDGEGVSFGLESGTWAAEAIAAAASTGFGTPAAEHALQGYHHRVKAEHGHYMSAGNIFVRLMGHPAVLDACLRFGLPRPGLMRPVNKLMSDLIAVHGGPLDDRLLRGLLRLL